jgi:hypothetical protein
MDEGSLDLRQFDLSPPTSTIRRNQPFMTVAEDATR